MKKLILMVAAMALVMPAVTAQKINLASVQAKLEKSDADVANPKKNGKAATWVNRAKIYTDAIVMPTKNIYRTLDVQMLDAQMGVPPTEKKSETIYGYEWVDVYTKNNKVIGWVVLKDVAPDAYKIVNEAIAKAYELDPAQAPKLNEVISTLVNYYSELGSGSVDIEQYTTAVDSYIKAARLQESPACGKVDPKLYFFAGQLAAFLGAQNVQYFIDGQNYLETAQKLGYKDDSGNLYYFLFHCFYGQRVNDRANVVKAKNTLLEGIEKYPRNERILDGLMQLYTSEDGIGDPRDLVSLIDKALAENPNNADLWFGRGRVFFKLENYDECIASFMKIDELKPNDYDTNFYLGYFNIAKGDQVNRAFNERIENISSEEEYQKGQREIMDTYMRALPWLERAHELKPENQDCVEYLKQLCFRLRNEPGVMEKYKKYDALYKQMKGL